MTKPLILLDFDGVFNAMAQMPANAAWNDMVDSSFAVTDGIIPVTYSPSVASFIAELNATGTVDIKWLTTWKQDSKVWAELFGLPVLDWMGDDEDDEYATFGDWWKMTVIRSLPSDQRILWIDDEIPMESDSPAQRFIAEESGRVQFIRPKSYVGLTPDHLGQMLTFTQDR